MMFNLLMPSSSPVAVAAAVAVGWLVGRSVVCVPVSSKQLLDRKIHRVLLVQTRVASDTVHAAQSTKTALAHPSGMRHFKERSHRGVCDCNQCRLPVQCVVWRQVSDPQLKFCDYYLFCGVVPFLDRPHYVALLHNLTLASLVSYFQVRVSRMSSSTMNVMMCARGRLR